MNECCGCQGDEVKTQLQGFSLSPQQRDLLLGGVPIHTCKLFLLGDGGVGKTALRKALPAVRQPNDPLEVEDDPDNPDTRTLGVEFESMELRTIPVCIQDHGGQKGFHIVHSMFLQSAYAVFAIVVRIDRHATLQDVEEQLRYWLKFLCSSVGSGSRSDAMSRVVVILSG